MYKQLLDQRLSISNPDQIDCYQRMLKDSRLTICLPTGGGKGHLMITNILYRLNQQSCNAVAIASHRLMLNSQHMTDILLDFLPLTGDVGYIFVGSIPFNSNFLNDQLQDARKFGDYDKVLSLQSLITEFNSRLAKRKLGYSSIISSVASAPQLNEKMREHFSAGRKVIIISTYHSLMKLASIDIDTIYCDEAHILATESQKEQALFRDNFNQITAKNYFFFTATPKDLVGLREGEETDSFLMNNTEIFGERIGITFASAVSRGYIVEPIIHLVRPADLIEGVEDFGSLEDKTKFVREAFYAHRTYMKNISAEPDKLGAKILVKCSSVTDEMWPLYNQLVNTMPGVKICAGASVENSDSTYISQGKHYIDGEIISKRDSYLKRLQALKPEDDAIILHFDILSEGINVSGFTGIMFLSGLMLTITKILQNIGRATRLHYLDRLRLIKKVIKITSEHLGWVKPCCSVIIPYWNDKSNETRRQMARIINDLRTRYDFHARLEVSLGDDRGTTATEEAPESLVEEEVARLRQSLIDEIEHEIDGIRLQLANHEEEKRVDNLSEDEWFEEMSRSIPDEEFLKFWTNK